MIVENQMKFTSKSLFVIPGLVSAGLCNPDGIAKNLLLNTKLLDGQSDPWAHTTLELRCTVRCTMFPVM